MHKLITLLFAFGALCAQDTPPAAPPAGAPPAAPVNPSIENNGKPMLVPFKCTDEDMGTAGLTCSETEPCPVYMELSDIASTGIRVFTVGNIHTSNATLFTILLGTEDNGQTWREFHERIRGAALDHLQFADVETGWITGLSFSPLPQDPFLLMTTDGGKTWRRHDIFNETRFGAIQQFFFEDKKSGSLIIDRGAGSSSDRYELYESNDGGETWNIKETNVKPLRIKAALAGPNPEWRVRADGPTKSFQLERRQGQRWTSIGAFKVDIGSCKPE